MTVRCGCHDDWHNGMPAAAIPCNGNQKIRSKMIRMRDIDGAKYVSVRFYLRKCEN